MRVTSGSWEGEKVSLRDQVLEVRKVEGRLHISLASMTSGTAGRAVGPVGPGVTGNGNEVIYD